MSLAALAQIPCANRLTTWSAFSFKERGARNALLQLTEEQKRVGVVAASAGNHALALAYHGKLLGIPVTCVMPNIAPLTKITSCQELGARVILHGSHILEAREKADEFARDEVVALSPRCVYTAQCMLTFCV